MGALRRRLTGLSARLCLCTVLVTVAPGCATITGLATGAFTGLVDGPAQVARRYEETYYKHPEYWALNILIVAPASFVLGPFFGMVKGIAVDVQWMRDETRYGDAFGTYGPPSIWRPYTQHFNPSAK